MTALLENAQSEPVDESSLRELAELVLSEEGFPPSSIVWISLVSDDEIARLNAEHLGREGPTDVLAFPLDRLEPGVVPEAVSGGPPISLGDVVVAPSQVARQASELGVETDDELALMVVHGVLHLMGYDHVDDAEAEAMEERERVILAKVGVTRR